MRHKCSQCPKTYFIEKQLKVHVSMTHTSLKLCELCDFTTPRGERLRRHMKIKHSDVRPFKCDQCDLSFKMNFMLRKHKVTHTGERNYPCTVCGKAFVTSSNLCTHRRIHEGKVAEHCTLCDKKFVQYGNYKLHMAKRHPDIPLQIQDKKKDR